MIERLMGLFWVMVQQFCFTCLKYAHDNIVGTGKTVKLLITQLLVLVILVVFCFETELGSGYLEDVLEINDIDLYAWVVRVTICGVMILFDWLLVLYFARIVRLYRRGIAAASPTLRGDLMAIVFVAVLCCAYLYLSITSSLRLGFDMDQYNWIGRFFIQISNFFYIALEVGGAVLAWFFLKQIMHDRNTKNEAERSELNGA